MKTVIIGGGKGCRALIKLATGTFLKELVLDVECVVDLNADAPGMKFARELGIRTTTDFHEAMHVPGVELIIELTGSDGILEYIYKVLPPGVKTDRPHRRPYFSGSWSGAREEQKQRFAGNYRPGNTKLNRKSIFLQSVFDNSPDLVAVLDPEKHFSAK